MHWDVCSLNKINNHYNMRTAGSFYPRLPLPPLWILSVENQTPSLLPPRSSTVILQTPAPWDPCAGNQTAVQTIPGRNKGCTEVGGWAGNEEARASLGALLPRPCIGMEMISPYWLLPFFTCMSQEGGFALLVLMFFFVQGLGVYWRKVIPTMSLWSDCIGIWEAHAW